MSALTEALVAAQKAMPAVQRDKINPAFKSRYVSLESLLSEVLPVLNANGLAVSQWPTYVIVGDVALPALATALIHGESGETIERTMLLLAHKADPQGQGSAITYAKRYALMALCGLSADEDDDGNAASRAGGKAKPSRSAQAPPAPDAAKVITAAQRTRLFAVAREAHIGTDTIKEIVLREAGVESSNDIPRDKYDAVISALQAAA